MNLRRKCVKIKSNRMHIETTYYNVFATSTGDGKQKIRAAKISEKRADEIVEEINTGKSPSWEQAIKVKQ